MVKNKSNNLFPTKQIKQFVFDKTNQIICSQPVATQKREFCRRSRATAWVNSRRFSGTGDGNWNGH